MLAGFLFAILEAMKASVDFLGGAESVTGSNFLFTPEGESPILIDCGLFQGSKVAEDENRKPFSFDPKAISTLVVTHAHIDHIGRVPKLVKEGFSGKIYSSPPTKDLAEFMLTDSIGVLAKEARRDGVPLIYDEGDVREAMRLWETRPYHEPFTIGSVSIVFRDSGHILGSAMAELTLGGKKIIFTGDLGNSPAPLLPDTERVTDATYLVMESVYGDRVHEGKEERRDKLEDVIEETMRAGGTLMIPAFSLERTQELLFEIENMVEHSRIPLVPVFLDSPLAIKVTGVYKKYSNYFNAGTREIIRGGDGIFKFPQLIMTDTTAESKRIYEVAERKIIIAGSGMSNGGRILHHEKRYLPDEKSTLLLMGYQAPGSLGRVLQDGGKSVTIMGEHISVRARVASISGYSAHKDANGLLDFVAQTADTVKKVFVVMGEPRASLTLVQRIRDYLGVDAVAPKAGEKVELEF